MKLEQWSDCVAFSRLAMMHVDSAKARYRLSCGLEKQGHLASALKEAKVAVGLAPQDKDVKALAARLAGLTASLPLENAEDEEARMAKTCRIFAVMASHIESEQRLALLRRCLVSIKCQSHRPLLAISWSAVERLQAPIEAMLAEMLGKDDFVLKSNEQLSQFDHYKRIFSKFSNARSQLESLFQHLPDWWVIFSDDDDVWHPLRTEVYFNALDPTGTCHTFLFDFSSSNFSSHSHIFTPILHLQLQISITFSRLCVPHTPLSEAAMCRPTPMRCTTTNTHKHARTPTQFFGPILDPSGRPKNLVLLYEKL
jgi:hypothetical protein